MSPPPPRLLRGFAPLRVVPVLPLPRALHLPAFLAFPPACLTSQHLFLPHPFSRRQHLCHRRPTSPSPAARTCFFWTRCELRLACREAKPPPEDGPGVLAHCPSLCLRLVRHLSVRRPPSRRPHLHGAAELKAQLPDFCPHHSLSPPHVYPHPCRLAAAARRAPGDLRPLLSCSSVLPRVVANTAPAPRTSHLQPPSTNTLPDPPTSPRAPCHAAHDDADAPSSMGACVIADEPRPSRLPPSLQ